LKEQQEIGKQVDEILKDYECEGQIDIWEWMEEKEQTMKRIKRIVDTGFWSDEKVMNFSPEDKYFWLFLLTNEYTTQLGIYYLPIKKAAFDLGYSVETVETLIERFEIEYDLIRFSETTNEVAIKNYLLYSVVKGGKPVYDCLLKDQMQVRDKSLLAYVYNNLKRKDIDNDTVKSYIESLSKDINDNDNDNDNERIVDESLTNREYKKPKPEKNIIPPTLEMVKAYCEERNNGIDAETFIDFYESKGWLIGKNRMKDWQSAIRTWEKGRKNQGNHEPKNSFSSGFELKV